VTQRCDHVAVQCESESHRGKVEIIVTFEYRDGRWRAMEHQSSNPRLKTWGRGSPLSGHRIQRFDRDGRLLTGPDVLDRDLVMRADLESRTARKRHVFGCSLCPDSVPALDEKLQPILEMLAENGVPSISLAGLRGRLWTRSRGV
jgi:hypothetical protein